MNTFAAALAALTLAATTAAGQQQFPDSHMITEGRISVEVIGKGPDVIFIPGLSSSRETWRATAERLKGRYRLHLIQVAGFAGESARANATGPVLIPTAEAIDAYVVSHHLAPATVVGHSLGGTIILWLAENRPQHLRKAMVVDAAPFFGPIILGPQTTPQSARAMGEKIRVGAPQPPAARDTMNAAMIGAADGRAMLARWEAASDPRVVQNALADDIELDLRPGLASIRTPITLLYPDNTPVGAPAGMMDKVYGAAFATAATIRLRRVDTSRHFIMFDEPAAFAADLDAFLAS
jgi:pimeloyl-ACP methyl ester carboxylesterase